MEHFSYIFTVFFMLFGPIKIIQGFAGLTRGAQTAKEVNSTAPSGQHALNKVHPRAIQAAGPGF